MRAKLYVIVWRLLWIIPLLVSYHIAWRMVESVRSQSYLHGSPEAVETGEGEAMSEKLKPLTTSIQVSLCKHQMATSRCHACAEISIARREAFEECIRIAERYGLNSRARSSDWALIADQIRIRIAELEKEKP